MTEGQSVKLLIQMISDLAPFLRRDERKSWSAVKRQLVSELGPQLQSQDWEVGQKIWAILSRHVSPVALQAFADDPSLEQNVNAVCDHILIALDHDPALRRSVLGFLAEAQDRKAYDVTRRIGRLLPEDLQHKEIEEQKRPRVFLSHASEDDEVVKTIIKFLHDNNIEVVNENRNIHEGDYIFEKLQEALGDCTHFVPLLTPNSIEKPWVKMEINGAIQLKIRDQADFIPLVYSLPRDEIPPLIAALKCMFIDDTVTGASRLVERIIGQPKPPKEETQPAKGAEQRPANPPHFVGRAREIRDLVATLCRPDPSPAALLGGPGKGKSTVCWKVLHEDEICQHYGDRRYYISLDHVRTADDMVVEIARRLGLHLTVNPLDEVIAKLGKERTLLVLDNLHRPWVYDMLECEQVLAALARARGSTFLAGVRGRDLPGGPSWGHWEQLQPLNDDDSKELFLAIIGEVDPLKMRDFYTQSGFSEFIQSLSGLPLVIQLMAKRAQEVNTLEDLKEEWQSEKRKRLEEPATSSTGLSLVMSLNLSLDHPRLKEDARRLLALLGVLPAGLADDDIAVVLPDCDPRPKEMLVLTGIAFERDGRVRLQDSVRSPVQKDHPPDPADLKKAIAHFYTLAERGSDIDRRTEDIENEHLFSEYANIDAMIRIGLTEDSRLPAMRTLVLSEADREEAVKAAISFSRYQRFVGIGSTNLLENAVNIARSNALDRRLEGECWRMLGSMNRVRSRLKDARANYQRALDIYVEEDDRLGMADCLRGLADTSRDRFDYASARRDYEQAVELYEDAARNGGGDRHPLRRDAMREITRGRAYCFEKLGSLALAEIEHDEAEGLFTDALGLYGNIDDVLGHAHCLKGLGDVAMAHIDLDSARDSYVEAQESFRGGLDEVGQANCIYSLGDVALRQRDFQVALVRYRDAQQLYDNVSHVHGRAICVSSIADVALARVESKRLDDVQAHDARAHYEEAKVLFRQLRDVIGEANCLQGLSDVAEAFPDQTATSSTLREKAAKLVMEGFHRKEPVQPSIGPIGKLSARWRR